MSEEGKLNEYELRDLDQGKKISPEDVVAIAQKAETEWLSKMRDPKSISDHIVRLLEGQLERVIAGALGFADHWGRWEVLRGGREPAIAQAIKKQCDTTARDLVAAALQNYKPRTEMTKLVRKEYESALKESVHEIARAMARENALELVSEILNRPVTRLQQALRSKDEEED